MSDRDESLPVTFELALSSELSEQLNRACERIGRSPGYVLEQALKQFLRSAVGQSSVYLSAPFGALMKGLYEENTTIADIKKHGDFGLGTFNHLDGEMVMLDGEVYQLRSDGSSHLVDDAAQTPFACVTFFHPTTVEEVETELEYPAFKSLLYQLIPSMNVLYAVRIDGCFETVKLWSVSKQENYRPIQDVGAEMFEFHDVEGEIVGFYTPDFMKPLSTAGYHLHFLTADRRHGGHLHQCRLKRGRISLQFAAKLELNLPITIDYLTTSLT